MWECNIFSSLTKLLNSFVVNSISSMNSSLTRIMWRWCCWWCGGANGCNYITFHKKSLEGGTCCVCVLFENVLKEKSIYFYTSAFFNFFSIRQNIFFNLPQMMHFYNSLLLFPFTLFLFLFKISCYSSPNQKIFSFTVIKNDSKCVWFRWFFFCFRLIKS